MASVIVVGAGIAGIAAASRLQASGWEVVVLEARDRLGGRIYTDRSWGLPIDLGANWVHGIRDNPVMDLVKQLNLNTRTTDYDNHWVYQTNGKLLNDRAQDELDDRLSLILNEVDEMRELMDQADMEDVSLQTAIDDVLERWHLSVEEQQQLEYAIAAEIEHDYAADSTELSCQYWDEGEEFDGEDCLFPQGYDELVNHLATDLDVRLQHIVQRVEYGKEVTVTCDRGSFIANIALITLPLGVLKSNAVQFSPALPKRKQKAIQRLGVGLLNKAVLRFPYVFWQADAEIIGYIPAHKGEWVEFYNLHPVTGQPILVGFNAGSYARMLESQSDAETIAAVMRTLRILYGSEIPNPVAALITRWAADPFARGAYSFIATHATDKDHEALAKPVADRLFFAGEATNRQYAATVHGALLSGWREANRINQLPYRSG